MRIPGWLFIVGLLLVVGLTGVLSVAAFVIARQAAIEAGVVFQGDVPSVNQLVNQILAQPTEFPTATPTLSPTQPPPDSAPTLTPGGPTPTPDPFGGVPVWNDPRRVNILLLGIDERRGFQDDEPAFRTDTIMIISVDPVRRTAGVLSLPRDLWVRIPGYSQGERVNTANFIGDINNYPGGGPALAAATVRENLGIEINYYIRINFDVFLTVVNTLAPNGIEVCPPEAIDDPKYPDAGFGTITVHFDPGCQRLNAERLLQYARTRATEGGDIDRARRQQEVVLAARNEILSVGGIANAITQAPLLFSELSSNIVTNMTFDQMMSLARLASEIPTESIRFEVLDYRHADPRYSADGTQQVLVPRQGDVRVLLDQVFGDQQTLTLADLSERAAAENATIVVFNNASISGLAASTQEWLTGRGVLVAAVDTMPNADAAPTYIRDYTGKPWTTRYLAALLGIPETRIQAANDGLTSADVMIVVGPDIEPLLAGGSIGQ